MAPDDAGLATAREVVRKSLAWSGIVADRRLRPQMTEGQITDAVEKARSFADSARKAVRAAWSHILYPVRSDMAHWQHPHGFLRLGPNSALRIDNEGRIATTKPLS